MIMVVMKETCVVDSINIVLMEFFVDDVKIVWKDRAVGE